MSAPAPQILFSVLVLSLPSRLERYLSPLYARLTAQLGDRRDVEILCLVDNKTLTIGAKRQALLDMARGRWLGFLDDDDDVSDDYMSALTAALHGNPADVITFKQHCIVNDDEFVVDFRMGNPHQPYMPRSGIAKLLRPPYHICMWRQEIARQSRFQDSSYGEDIAWCSRLYPLVRSETHIDATLHRYRYSDRTSESIQFAAKPQGR